MAFFAIPGMRAQGDALRSGGQRKLALPESGPDPTDASAILAAHRARRFELSGERRLVFAVFTSALDDVRRYPPMSRPYHEAWEWLMSDAEGSPFAFRSACATLDLDAEAVRTRIRATVPPPEPMNRVWARVRARGEAIALRVLG